MTRISDSTLTRIKKFADDDEKNIENKFIEIIKKYFVETSLHGLKYIERSSNDALFSFAIFYFYFYLFLFLFVFHPFCEIAFIKASTCQYVPVRASTCQYVPVRASTCQYVQKSPFHLHVI